MSGRARYHRALMLAALFFPALAAPCRAELAALWIPADDALDGVVELLEEDESLRLTAALPALPGPLAGRIKSLVREGRLEVALRFEGDPPVPLLYYPSRPGVEWAGKLQGADWGGDDRQFLMLRFDRAVRRARADYGGVPAGFVAPPGNFIEDYAPLARSIGLRWLAFGAAPEVSTEVYSAGGVLGVLFSAVPVSTEPLPGSMFLVFDELGSDDPQALRALMTARLAEAAGEEELLTVSQAVELSTPAAVPPGELALLSGPWAGDYSGWASAPAQRTALSALAQTRRDLLLYLNERGGNYDLARKAFEAYFAAEEGSRLADLAAPEAAARASARRGMTDSLREAYTLMKRNAPAWTFGAEERSGDDSIPLALEIQSLAGGFSIANAGRPAAEPGEAQAGAAGARLGRFELTSDKETVLFRLLPAAGTADGAPYWPPGLTLDVYIDVNHRPRAGRARPLPGRPFAFYPENAWEHALTVTDRKAALYSYSGRKIRKAGEFEASLENGALVVRIPRKLLRGAPVKWGYSVFALSPKGAKAFSIADHIAAGVSSGYVRPALPGRR